MRLHHGQIYWTLQRWVDLIVRSCNIYVIISFICFINIHLIFLPIYFTLYLLALAVYIYRIYTYVYTPNQRELASLNQFRHFRNVYVEFIYNITFRRACVNSFIIIYKILKFCKGSTLNKPTIPRKLITYTRVLFYCAILLIFNVVFGTSWFIVRRSFQYSKAFWFSQYSLFDPYIMRVRIINNYQTKELFPGLSYRIYKTDNFIWNFN